MRLLTAFILLAALPGLNSAQPSENDSESQNPSQVDLPRSEQSRPSPPSPTWKNRSRACEVFIGVDETLFDHFERNMTTVVQFAQAHVDELNNIFIKQVFGKDSDRYFRLSRVQVVFINCVGIVNCIEDTTVYLNLAAAHFSDFCLNVIFTHREFKEEHGVASQGALCNKAQNTVAVSLSLGGQFVEFEMSSLIFAHEVGHIFGAHHDGDFKMCRDDGSIMSPSDEKCCKRKFSSCSILSMRVHLRNLELKINGVEDCFVNLPANNPLPAVETSLCGNGIAEPGEQCDCGSDLEACNNQYCYPVHLSESDRMENAVSCQFTPESPELNQPVSIDPESQEFYVDLVVSIGFFLFLIISIVIGAITLYHVRCQKKKIQSHEIEMQVRPNI